jgi:hypothetical protein
VVVEAAKLAGSRLKMRKLISLVAPVSAALVLLTLTSTQADTFRSDATFFNIDFVDIGNLNNPPLNAVSRIGAVPYFYRIGAYEITQDQIEKAIAGGLANVVAGPWTGKRPATDISWYEAAAYVNWLNTSKGYQEAYKLTWDGSAWIMGLWTGEEAWTSGGTNLHRHKNAVYFLPSQSEWIKAAHYNHFGSNYFDYPTASDTAPTAVVSGTNPGTAVYKQPLKSAPAEVDCAGGRSPYGTIGQGGNVDEWIETDRSGATVTFGGAWPDSEWRLRARSAIAQPRLTFQNNAVGFRVASVLEPDTDGDGIPDANETNTGVYVSPADTGTDPNNPDSDGDTLPDGVETASYVYIDAMDVGTDPNTPDSDGDGLSDSVETNTGVYVSATDTGTSPLNEDTSSDGITDGEAVAAQFNPLIDQRPVLNFLTQAVAAQPNRFGFYNEANVMHLGMGGLMIRKAGSVVNLDLQWQTKNSLTNSWTNHGAPLPFFLNLPGSKAFIRLQATPGAP